MSEMDSHLKSSGCRIINIHMTQPDVEIIGTINRIIDSPRPVLLHGPGGTGKSYLLKHLAVVLRNRRIRCGLCAPTGIAAWNLKDDALKVSARTLHSFCGIGMGKGSVEQIVKRIQRKRAAMARIMFLQVLIIDEISMVGAEFFEKLSLVFQLIRNDTNLFGGVKLVLSGDFLQLPPIRDRYLFESPVFKRCNFEVVTLTTPHRYASPELFALMMRCRYGKMSEEDKDLLQARRYAFDELNLDDSDIFAVRPTMLMTRRDEVDAYNAAEMRKLPGKLYTFRASDIAEDIDAKEGETDDGYEPMAEYIPNDKFLKGASNMLNDRLPDVIHLKVGAQVMLKVNLDIENGLTNGTRGVIVELCPKPWKMVMKLVDDRLVRIDRFSLKLTKGRQRAIRKQLPIVPAFALTIHKSQGLTIDYGCIRLVSTFCGGQGYVALSRFTDLSGLFLSAFSPEAVYPDQKAIDYVKKLEEAH